jgi:hypothetical protein
MGRINLLVAAPRAPSASPDEPLCADESAVEDDERLLQLALDGRDRDRREDRLEIGPTGAVVDEHSCRERRRPPGR